MVELVGGPRDGDVIELDDPAPVRIVLPAVRADDYARNPLLVGEAMATAEYARRRREPSQYCYVPPPAALDWRAR